MVVGYPFHGEDLLDLQLFSFFTPNYICFLHHVFKTVIKSSCMHNPNKHDMYGFVNARVVLDMANSI